MTKHSTLTNPNDLHYAKIRTFTGDPNAIAPDFIDQILTATDTNKVYRSFGLNNGEIVELLAPSNLVTVGGEYPSNQPSSAGSIFFSNWTSELYISVQNSYGVNYWKPYKWVDAFFGLRCVPDYEDLPHSSDTTFSLLYSPLTEDQIISAPFEFTEVIQSEIPISVTPFDLSWIMRSFGRGCYSVGYTVNNPNNYYLYGELINNGAALPSAFNLSTSSFEITAFGQRISRTILFYSGDIVPEVIDLLFRIRRLEVGG